MHRSGAVIIHRNHADPLSNSESSVSGAIRDAIQREKRIKKWNRTWKVELIEKTNPAWDDLYDELMERPGCLRKRE